MGAGGAGRGPTAEVSDPARTAYDRAGPGWRAGPEPLYAALAARLVARSPVPVRGARVLDLGAGTGAASRMAAAAGATVVVAVDPSAGMLAGVRPAGLPVSGDAAALPFPDRCFDLVVAAMSLGHLTDPLRALRECRRVAPALLASAFEAGWTHPAKGAVDEVLAAAGYRPPPWYLTLKNVLEPRVGDPDRLRALAGAAGFRVVVVEVMSVPSGLDSPARLAAWRLGLAHVVPFLQTLPVAERAALRHAAEEAVRAAAPPVARQVVLAAR